MKWHVYSLEPEQGFYNLLLRNEKKFKKIIFQRPKDFIKEKAFNIFLTRGPSSGFKKSKYLYDPNGVCSYTLDFQMYSYIIDCYFNKNSIIVNLDRFFRSTHYRRDILIDLEMNTMKIDLEDLKNHEDHRFNQLDINEKKYLRDKKNISHIKE